MNHNRKKSRVAAMSVISNSTLVVFKLIVGLYSGAVSILSEAIHSGVDLIAARLLFLQCGLPENQPMRNILSVMVSSKIFQLQSKACSFLLLPDGSFMNQ